MSDINWKFEFEITFLTTNLIIWSIILITAKQIFMNVIFSMVCQ